jgi:Ni,Fe-hydrogenase III small subunit
MEKALLRTYNATPPPKLVVAVGNCGFNGGIFGESYAALGGIGKIIPVDAYIPGCPPTPADLLRGILKLIGG